DELDLVLLAEEPATGEGMLGLHSRSGAFHDHHVPQAAALPLIGDGGIERAQVDLAVRLEGMDEGVREPTNRGRDGHSLEEGLAAGPADIPDPSAVGGRARELADLADDVVHVDLREFAS